MYTLSGKSIETSVLSSTGLVMIHVLRLFARDTNAVATLLWAERRLYFMDGRKGCLRIRPGRQ